MEKSQIEQAARSALAEETERLQQYLQEHEQQEHERTLHKTNFQQEQPEHDRLQFMYDEFAWNLTDYLKEINFVKRKQPNKIIINYDNDEMRIEQIL